MRFRNLWILYFDEALNYCKLLLIALILFGHLQNITDTLLSKIELECHQK